MKNARAMAEAGAATILPERDLNSDSLATAILRILGVVLNFLSCFVIHRTIPGCWKNILTFACLSIVQSRKMLWRNVNSFGVPCEVRSISKDIMLLLS